MAPQVHNHTAATQTARNRVEHFSNHLPPYPVQARHNVIGSQIQHVVGSPAMLHHQTGLPPRQAPTPWHSPAHATVSLPPFSCFAEVADQSNLHYMRSPSVGSEYIPVPLIKMESTYNSPPESVVSLSRSGSVSPTISAATLSSCNTTKRRAPLPSRSRIEKKTKCTKRKDMSAMAEALDESINRRVDEVHRPYRDGNMPGTASSRVNASQSFPRFDHAHIPRGAKRAKSTTGSSDPSTRHNVAQTYLRAEKGGSRMTLQRLLVNGINWRGQKLQTKVNARSSGMLYEEKELLQASTQFNAFAILILQQLFGPEGMQHIGSILECFEPEEVHPMQVARDPQDDDKTYEFKRQAARVEVIAEASQPLGLKNVQSMDELLHIIEEKVMPIANNIGKQVLHQMCYRPRESQAKF
ncbi:hypothetical protein D6C78_08946 [Aureobasidium pullulans]|uniref:Uncharacterized protein n=1 Tax=Aureobasidium pullulans TaxID=5580 RepID=A0A4T0BCE8_AURPU|nr:hypothetical protein D6C78_08946 [Aureobasidium pullulans]